MDRGKEGIVSKAVMKPLGEVAGSKEGGAKRRLLAAQTKTPTRWREKAAASLQRNKPSSGRDPRQTTDNAAPKRRRRNYCLPSDQRKSWPLLLGTRTLQQTRQSHALPIHCSSITPHTGSKICHALIKADPFHRNSVIIKNKIKRPKSIELVDGGLLE